MEGKKAALFSTPLVITFMLGFSSGLPLLTTLDMLKAWLKDSQVELALIGFSGLVGLPYTLKFIWAPFFDRFVPPLFGRRRGWMLVTQCGGALALAVMAASNPIESPLLLGCSAFLVTFFSASQDVVVDAHRRDSFSDKELVLASSYFLTGYRVGMLMSGAIALNLAEFYTWPQVYLIMAACMLVGVAATIMAGEPEVTAPPPKSMREAIIEPLREYFSKNGAWLILAFIVLYKLGDMMASTMTIPFYKDVGFSWGEVGSVAKVFGIIATIAGGILGGVIAVRTGLYRALWIFGALQAIGILGFPLLLLTGPNIYALAAVISFENFSVGLATSAFVTMMGILCNKRFSATQYALLTSLSGVPRTIFGSSSGVLAEWLGWGYFFIGCFLLAIPGLYLLTVLKSYLSPKEDLN
ncbi:MAG: AmpG family muropeptide MFS transporter [Deltaproteobacteria bacterium]|nr:AmpG family muropeptide MFS transporter [Deltaproteobacteria bacterium]